MQGIQLRQQTNKCNTNGQSNFQEKCKKCRDIERFPPHKTCRTFFVGWANEPLKNVHYPTRYYSTTRLLSSLPYPTLPEIEKPLPFRPCPSPTAKEGKIPLLWWVRGGNSPLPPSPPPTAKEGPTPHKGWALRHGGQTPVSPQLKTNSPPPPLHSDLHVYSCGNRNA